MYFPHELVVYALSGNLDDPRHFKRAYKALVTSRLTPDLRQTIGSDYKQAFLTFLKQDIPPIQEIVKVVLRLGGLAEQYGAHLHDFRWWEIVPGLRALVAGFECRDQEATVCFYWKKSEKGAPISQIASKPKIYTGADGECKVEFEDNTYQRMRAQYHDWLKKGMPESPFAMPALMRAD